MKPALALPSKCLNNSNLGWQSTGGCVSIPGSRFAGRRREGGSMDSGEMFSDESARARFDALRASRSAGGAAYTVSVALKRRPGGCPH